MSDASANKHKNHVNKLLQLNNVLNLTKNGPAQEDCLIEGSRLVGADVANLTKLTSEASEQDATGKWLMPPLVDLCARLREPGAKQHGTLVSEGRAAMQNGFAHVVMPPDTQPVLEDGSLLAGLRDKAARDSGVHLHLLGALTAGLEGARPANLAGLKQGGAVGLSNARKGFANDEVLLRTLEYAASLDLTVFFYPDEPSLSKNGCAHDGYVASKHGLVGIPWIAETVALSKQILMVEETGVRAHFGLLTTASSVELIRWAKQKGLPVTADVAMHQLFLTDDDIAGFNSLAHVLPPLRSNTDQKALRAGLSDGTLDAICSHHEPLSKTAKLAPFAETEAGISNFDTFMALGCALVADGVLDPVGLVQKVCVNPARIAGIEALYDAAGGLVLVDPQAKWQVTADAMCSAGKNTPFLGRELIGRVEKVWF